MAAEGIKVTGVRRAVGRMELLAGRRVEAAGAFNMTAARTIAGRSQQLVPIDTGALMGSMRVEKVEYDKSVDRQRSRRTGRFRAGPPGARVRYGSPKVHYAVYVHERLDVHHKRGQAKYLEQAVKENQAKVAPGMARAMRRIK